MVAVTKIPIPFDQRLTAFVRGPLIAKHVLGRDCIKKTVMLDNKRRPNSIVSKVRIPAAQNDWEYRSSKRPNDNFCCPCMHERLPNAFCIRP